MKLEPNLGAPGHEALRWGLRVAGPLVLLLGLGFTVVGFVSFFASFGSFGPPRYFWCIFVGFPLIFVGLLLCKLGFLGAALRYYAGEAAPVQRDAFNYLAEGTRPGVRTVSRAIGEGLGLVPESESEPEPEATVRCGKCQTPNAETSNYCSQCGSPLGEQLCSGCGEPVVASARFCGRCGQARD